jgi:hypothetical protein
MELTHGGRELIVQRTNMLEESIGSDPIFAAYALHDG